MKHGKRISRGEFLKGVGAAGLTGSTLSVLSACSMNTSPQQGGGGDGGSDALNFYNWTRYVAESTIPDFEENTGIQVTMDNYATNEELLGKLQAGGTGYDVIVPSDYMVTIMKKSDLLMALDRSKIPNFENLGENFVGLSYDPENKYSVPYQWGTTGILYNREELGEITNWEALWNPEYEGSIGMLDELRETMGVALYRLGYSVNTKDSEKLQEAKELLLKQKPLLLGYFGSAEAYPKVVQGSLLLSHVWSGEAFAGVIENDSLDYVIPRPAATRWTDNMCILKSAPHPDNAHKFINYILEPKVSAEISNYTYFSTPNEAALPKIDDKLTSIPSYTPPPETFERLQIIEDLGEASREYSEIFTAVKSD